MWRTQKRECTLGGVLPFRIHSPNWRYPLGTRYPVFYTEVDRRYPWSMPPLRPHLGPHTSLYVCQTGHPAAGSKCPRSREAWTPVVIYRTPLHLGQSVPIRVWRSFPLAYTCLWWRKRGWRHWFLEWHLQQALRQYHWCTCSGGNLDVEWSSILWTAGSTVRMLPLFYWTPRDELAIGFHLPAYHQHRPLKWWWA